MNGYMDLERNPSGKRVRIRADFVGMVNETNKGTMLVLMDGNQVFLSENYDFFTDWQNKILAELGNLSLPKKTPKAEMEQPAVSPLPADLFADADDEIPF